MELFLLTIQDLNPGKATFGKPYSSTQGIPPKAQLVLLLICIVFFCYIIFKVRKSLKFEIGNKKRNCSNKKINS